MSAKERADAVNEIRVLASVSGPHVITFYEAFVDADILYIVTEFAGHGDLLAYLKAKRRSGNIPEQTIWSLFIQMCLGVKTMHDANILHRDLKAANVFMCSPNYLKLGDRGVAKVLKHDEALARTQVGTPYYVAPEVWRNKAYNSKCDMWSLGCLLYELCTFRPPFEAESMEGLARKVMRGRYDPIPSGYSQGLKNVIAKLLVVEPAHRASVNDVLASEAVQQRLTTEIERPVPNDPPPDTVDLVSTIQVPRRFNDLTKNLPPSRYESAFSGVVPTGVTPSATPSVAGGAGESRRPMQPVHKPTSNPAEDGALKAEAQAKLARMRAQKEEEGLKLPQITHAGRGAVGGPPQPAGGAPPPANRQRVAPAESGNQGIRLPQVPGAQGRPSQQQQGGQQQPHRARYYDHAQRPPPSREIRMVYHQPNGDSRVSIFQRRPPSSQNSYYNPITHQNSEYAAGSRYHMRRQPQGVPYSNVPQAADAYTAQRRRIGNNWY